MAVETIMGMRQWWVKPCKMIHVPEEQVILLLFFYQRHVLARVSDWLVSAGMLRFYIPLFLLFCSRIMCLDCTSMHFHVDS